MIFMNLDLHIARMIPRILFTIAFFILLLSAQSAHAADILFSPSTGSYNTGQTFTVTVQVDPKGDSVNAVEAEITYDPKLLSVVSLAKTGSVFSLWTTEPTFSNTAGTISFGGGSPSPFSSRSNLVVITFRAVAPGSARVAFGTASALAADGRGTDVLEASIAANYTVTAATTPTPTPTPEPEDEPEPEPEPEGDNEPEDATIAFGEPPRAPVVGSQTFLDPEVWYATNTALFAWELPFDITAVAVEVATSADHVPKEVFEPPIEELLLTAEDLIDGIQYLSIRFENQVGWGAVLNRKIMVDTKPPQPFEINVQTGNAKTAFPLLTFAANDETSGIDRYELVIARREPVTITPEEAALGYLLGELEDGTYTVSITAFDKAGNSYVASAPVLITAGWLPPSETADETTIWSFFTAKNIFIIFLILLNLAQIAYQLFERRQHAHKEEKLRKETKEIQDQMEKIFSALRDEIYDQINMITQRPRLSKREREAVEGLNNALEVSETLIEKEINDVKKILK
jgi:Cohesin domain